MRKAQECMMMTMMINIWLELELIRGINDQNLQKRLLQEKTPMLQDMISIATQWQSAETATAQFIIDNEPSENKNEPEEVNDTHYRKTLNRKKGPVTGNLNSAQDHTDKEDATQADCNKQGKADSPTDTLNNGKEKNRLCENNNHMTGKSFDRRPKMYNIKITPVTSGYQFSSNVYQDTGFAETIIAASMTERQRMSILPHTRQLQSTEGHQWRITGTIIFNVDYQGQSARVEALILPKLKEEIFLGWTTLRDLMSGPICGNQFPTPNAKVKRSNDIEPKSLHNHANTTRLAGTPRCRQEYRTPNKPCPRCGEEKNPPL